MRVLYLCNKQYWNQKMSRVRFHSINAIGRHPEVELIKSGPGWPGFVNAKVDQDKYKPNVVVWYKPLDIPGYEWVTAPKCLRYNEMWGFEWTAKEITQSKSNIIICHHANDISNYTSIKTAEFYNNPHCVEKTIFKDYGLSKEIDVLLVGVLSSTFYPFRAKLNDVLNMIGGRAQCKVLPHPGYRIADVNSQVVRYAQEINKSKITLTCSSKYRYALAKYSEIPLCASLLCADVPGECEVWYRSWMLDVEDSMTCEQIAEKILYYVKNDIKRNTLIKKGIEENLNRRTQEHYANRFVQIIKEYLS